MTLVRATTTIHLPGPLTIAEGSILEDSDPIVKRCASFFEPVEVTARRDADLLAHATAGRGKKR